MQMGFTLLKRIKDALLNWFDLVLHWLSTRYVVFQVMKNGKGICLRDVTHSDGSDIDLNDNLDICPLALQAMYNGKKFNVLIIHSTETGIYSNGNPYNKIVIRERDFHNFVDPGACILLSCYADKHRSFSFKDGDNNCWYFCIPEVMQKYHTAATAVFYSLDTGEVWLLVLSDYVTDFFVRMYDRLEY